MQNEVVVRTGRITFGEEEALQKILLVGKVFRGPNLKRRLAMVDVAVTVTDSINEARRVIGSDRNHFDAVFCDRLGDNQLVGFARRLRTIGHQVLETSTLFARSGHEGLAGFDRLTSVGFRRSCGDEPLGQAILDSLGRRADAR